MWFHATLKGLVNMNTLLFATIVALTNACGTVRVDTLGANVVSYVPNGGREVLFRQTEGRVAEKWYHGGVPICWPWFGWNGDPGSRQHGAVWDRDWKVVAREEGAACARLVLALEKVDGCRLTYEIELGQSLALNLSMRNDGTRPLPVTTGLHPYFAISQTTNVLVKTPSESIVLRGEVNALHHAASGRYEIADAGFGRTIGLDFWGNRNVVVWNCGANDPQQGFAPGDWRRYVSVEPTVLPRASGFFLMPGETRRIGMRVSVSATTARRLTAKAGKSYAG